MTRYDEIKVLPYTATVPEKVALESVEWCEHHQGFGNFSFNWVYVINRDQFFECVVGELGFSDHRDHMLFTMMWC